MKKRVLSVLLVLIMVIGMMPATVLAEEAETSVPNYLTFTAKEDNSTIRFSWLYGSAVQISRDGGSTWENYDKDATITLNTDETVSFKGKNIGTTYDYRFHMTGKIAASGSVTSLTDENGGDPGVRLEKACYGSLFRECDALITAPELPATKLSQSCYTCMFYGCKNLTAAPELPALEAAELCYSYMFASCLSLTEAPKLPATVVGSQSYLNMFWNCTKLTKAPALPAETLKDYCYSHMFEGCTGLNTAPALPAITMVKGCYKQMFAGCASLTAAPELPATTLAEGCYDQMFSSCSSLKIGTDRTDTPWKIHAKSVPDNAANWNNNMFAGCANVDFGGNSQMPALNTRYYTGDTRPDLEPVAYLYYTADGNTAVCHDDGSCTEYETVAEDAPVFRDGKWYVVSDDVTFDRRITVNGTANLILCNGAALTASNGIEVSGENALNIFAQSEDANTMGKLNAMGGEGADTGRSTINYAGIGGGDNENCGVVTIHGGEITVYGGKSSAGIGGGNGGAGGTVTIYGGKITAYGDYGSGGIGAGNNGNGGMVTIYGGAVDVTGGAAGAGIGGSVNRDGGSVTINGGTVNVDGGAYGAAIGSGWQGTGGSVTINGGTVNAIGSDIAGAAIGGGEESRDSTVTINGGTVTATGGAAGIGNCAFTLGEGLVFGAGEDAKNITQWGYNSDASNAVGKKYFVTPFDVYPYTYYTTEGAMAIKHDDGCCLTYEIVTDGTTEFESGKWYVVSDDVTVNDRITVNGTANLILCDGAALTASNGIEVSGEKALNIYGQSDGTGVLIAKTEKNGSDATIGSCYGEACGSINVHGGSITATGSNNGAGIGGSTSVGGTINIFGGTVTAVGGKNSAGIGGGNGGADGTITIYGGTVNASGGETSAAIGGGWNSRGGTITINGGEINATGGESAAGIGGGKHGVGDTITINGGEVNATGGDGGASAIGGNGDTVTINGGAVTATAGENWSYAIDNCTLTLGEGVTFGAGNDANNITVIGGKSNASNALRQRYFVTPYEHKHIFDQEVVNAQYLKSAVTCTEAAVYFKSCECGEASATDTFISGKALGHSYGEATYTWNGQECTAKVTCSDCTSSTKGHTVTDTVAGIYTEDTPATCTESAKGHYRTVFLNELFENQNTEADSVKHGNPLGHEFGAWEEADDVQHKCVCTRCKTETKYGNHAWIDATCTTPKTCAFCQATEGDPLGHTLTGATCTEAPYCLACHEYVGEPLGHLLTEADCTVPVFCLRCHKTISPALGHDWGEWGTISDTQHQRVCANDATHVETENHHVIGGKCDICGYLAALLGDVNGDGEVNQKDVARLRQYLADSVNYPLDAPQNADVNNDGKINRKDVARLRQYLADSVTYPLG